MTKAGQGMCFDIPLVTGGDGLLVVVVHRSKCSEGHEARASHEAERIARALDGSRAQMAPQSAPWLTSVRSISTVGGMQKRKPFIGAQLGGWTLPRIILNCSVHHSGRLPGEEVDA
jgi:hypothetical protein